MEDALLYGRLQFAFTITFHYLFPQLTMGLGLLIVIFKTIGLRRNDPLFHLAARFWTQIFAINFVMGVVTGIPMEFQFGTNWARFSQLTGGIVGQTLALEGMYSFFLESTFLGLFLYGEKRLSPIMHWLSAVGVFIGSWLSGYFIVLTNAWMQHPVGYEINDAGEFVLTNFSALFTNPWATWQYLHTMTGAVVTAAFVMAGTGAFYLLSGRENRYGKLFVRYGVIAGLVASILMAFPTGDAQAKNMAHYQPASFAAMEGLFETKKGAGIALIGQPNMRTLTLDNPIHVPNILSILTYASFDAVILGLKEFPRSEWPTNVPALYYSYHIMAGLGTLFIGLMSLAAFLLFRRKLYDNRKTLWALLLFTPLPYIANTAGWYTAELGRQPWLVYGLLRTTDGVSPNVSDGNTLFTLIGFIGLYFLLGVLFLLLTGRLIHRGPSKVESIAQHAEVKTS